MEQKHVGLILQLVIVALLAVIAFELAQQPQPVDPTGNINDVSSQVQALDKDVQALTTQLGGLGNNLYAICSQVVPFSGKPLLPTCANH
jgi:hypothetical protein